MCREIYSERHRGLTVLVLSLWKHSWDEILNFPHLSKPASLEHSAPLVYILLGHIWCHMQE